jgi:hypothetical protein
MLSGAAGEREMRDAGCGMADGGGMVSNTGKAETG